MKSWPVIILVAFAVLCGSCMNPKNKTSNDLLYGEWILDSSAVTPAYLPSFCEELYAGSRFVFDEENHLTVYPDTSNKKCNRYSYHFDGRELHLTEWDMVMVFPVAQRDSNQLILRNSHITYERRLDDRSLDDVHEYMMYLRRK